MKPKSANSAKISWPLPSFCIDMGWCLADYNPGNILYHKDSEGKYRFALVDINRFYFGHPTMARCMRSFTQLSGARLSQLVVLIRRYCDVRHWDPKRAWKYFQLYRRSLCRKERIKSKFKSLLGLLP